jgi:hypothetical protein
MLSDDALLASCPDFISVGGLLKASPSEEGGERILFFEASNEDVDHQNEVVLQKALAESAEYYLRHGNVDLSHYSLLGPKSGISDFMSYEIGKPIDVSVNGKRTFVKAQLYRGESPMAKNANMVWESLTKQSPPSRWFPSVGGAVLSKSIKIDPETKARVAVIEKVRWNNVALDRCPVNRTVPEVSTAPVGTFAKSLGGFVVKALEAGYGTDSASLTGGAAMRKQSLSGANYHRAREKVSSAMLNGGLGENPGPHEIMDFVSREFGVSPDEGAEFTERLLGDIHRNLKRR